jgi:hypothetical protein
MNEIEQVSAALQEWTEVLSPEFVLTGERVTPYLVNCLSLTRSIPAVLRPDSKASVQAIVRIAAERCLYLFYWSQLGIWHISAGRR